MRTHLIRGVLAIAVLTTAYAAPALAQSQVKGTVLDVQKKPVEGATVTFEAVGAARSMTATTDKKGEFLQIGLPSGEYKVTATKAGIGAETLPARVTVMGPVILEFVLGIPAAAAKVEAANAVTADIRDTANKALEAVKAGRNDEAIALFKEVIGKAPTCGDCYYNLGVVYSNKQAWGDAEEAFKKAIELKPDGAGAYQGLVTAYNAQKKFDLAALANKQLATLSAGTPAGAEASYNEGVVAFNAGKFADAKTQFEAATKSDPTLAPAFYQLGMTNLNLGHIPEAVTALETYLKVAPDGPKAAEVKAALPSLQAMIKKK